MSRHRWLVRLHAWLAGYFWRPCPACGRMFSGWEWSRDKFTVEGPWEGSVRKGWGVCSEPCTNVAYEDLTP